MTPNQIPDLLSALSDELADMRRVVDGLSALMLDHARLAPPDERARVVGEAQAVDALGQKLDALQGVAASLARGRPLDVALDAIPLQAMADRLRRAVQGGHPGAAAARAGDLMLFD